MTVYGYVNGQAVYSAEEFRYKKRGFGAITNDEELLAYAQKVTSNWYYAGHHHTFETFYLSDYACGEPSASLTRAEFKRLQELQKQAQEEAKRADEAREWKLEKTIHWADNSIEEIYVDKDGNRKSEMVCQPHGDACY